MVIPSAVQIFCIVVSLGLRVFPLAIVSTVDCVRPANIASRLMVIPRSWQRRTNRPAIASARPLGSFWGNYLASLTSSRYLAYQAQPPRW